MEIAFVIGFVGVLSWLLVSVLCRRAATHGLSAVGLNIPEDWKRAVGIVATAEAVVEPGR